MLWGGRVLKKGNFDVIMFFDTDFGGILVVGKNARAVEGA
jgi:hypothetical protein